MRRAVAIAGFFAPLFCFAQQPDSFAENHAAGEFYIQKKDLASAIPFLQKAYDIDPKNYDNAYNLALAYLESGAFEKSRAVLTTLISAQDRAELHNLLGDIEAKEGHIETAAEQYRTAAQMEPSEKNLFDLGNHLVRYRGFESAEKVFSFGVERYPKSAELHVGLGVAYYSLGRYDEAIDALCRAVDLNPTDTRALGFLGKMYDIAPQKEEKISARLARFAQEYPNNAAANYYYALSLRRRTIDGGSGNEHKLEAAKLLERAVALDPNFSDAHFELGLLYEDENQTEKGIREYQLALKNNPVFAKAHYHLARLYQKNGDQKLASIEFHKFQQLKDSGK